MTQEQREKIKYVPVVYNKDDNLCYINVKFKEIEKYIPYKIFKVNIKIIRLNLI